MKRYLWVSMILVFMGANASDNPFDLSVNLKKIDQDQDVLLSELRDMAEAKEKKEEKSEQEKTKKVEETGIQVDEAVVIQAKVSAEESIKSIKEEQVKIEAQRAEKEKAAQAKLELKKIEKEEQERLAAEKLEVEKYEAQRVAKKKLEEKELAQLKAEKAKIESKKLALEKQKAAKSVIVDINITREEIDAEKEAAKTYKEAVIEVDKEEDLAQLKAEKAKLESKKLALEKQKVSQNVIVDINITREEIEAEKEADKTYKEAVIEVDKED